jgi:hypothetical protein
MRQHDGALNGWYGPGDGGAKSCCRVGGGFGEQRGTCSGEDQGEDGLALGGDDGNVGR